MEHPAVTSSVSSSLTPERSLRWFVVVLAVLIVAGITLGSALRVSNSIVIYNQELGGRVFVNELTLARGGFVAISSATWLSNEYNDLAVSAYFPPGRYKNISLPVREIFIQSPEALELHRGLLHNVFLVENLNKDTKNFEGLPMYHVETTRPLEKLLGGYTTTTIQIR